tara:strand:+ start:188 stop:526 length:339 start_codon:yes stop_codon:yes gene_type:complete
MVYTYYIKSFVKAPFSLVESNDTKVAISFAPVVAVMTGCENLGKLSDVELKVTVPVPTAGWFISKVVVKPGTIFIAVISVLTLAGKVSLKKFPKEQSIVAVNDTIGTVIHSP